jgi:type IV pilus assembly protein PilM
MLLKNLFKKDQDTAVGIDIGSSSIKVVQLRRKGGKALLETYGELALGPYANTDIGRATNLAYDVLSKALTDVLRESKITATAAGIAIPYGSSLISLIEMPKVAENQLDQMMPIEARKYIPVPIAEVMLDWWVVPRVSNEEPLFAEEEKPAPGEAKPVLEKIDVLLVAIHNDTITKYQQIATKSSVDTKFFEIEIFSTVRSVIDQEVAPIMVCDVGAALTKLYIVERGVLQRSHTIPRGAQDITLALSQSLGKTMTDAEVMKRNLVGLDMEMRQKADQVIDVSLSYIFAEIGKIVTAYQKRTGKNIAKTVFVGGGVKLAGFLDKAKGGVGMPVELGNAFSKVESPAFLEPLLKTTGPEFTVAIGTALRVLAEKR